MSKIVQHDYPKPLEKSCDRNYIWKKRVKYIYISKSAKAASVWKAAISRSFFRKIVHFLQKCKNNLPSTFVQFRNVDYFCALWHQKTREWGAQLWSDAFWKLSHKLFTLFNLLTDQPRCGIILASQVGGICAFCYANGNFALETVRNRALSGAGVTSVNPQSMPTSGSVTGGVPMHERSCAVGTTACVRSLRLPYCCVQ